MVELVTGSVDFYIVHVMSVDGRQAHSTVVHLPSKDLIPKEIVSKDPTVSVRTEDTFVLRDIWKISKHSVHAVVLLLHIIQVLCIFINGETSKHSLQKQEGVEVFMVPVRGVVEDSNVRVDHFIITNEHQSRDEYRLFLLRFATFSRELMEMLLN